MSSVDWPGKLVATVFCQGCPWACPYCHNHAIIDPRIPGVVAWSSVTALMERRHGLLDGVVFSGGEATRQWALIPAMQDIKSLGFEIGLHTAGPYPARLARLLDEGLLDWVGLDIKALPGPSYEAVAGRQGAGEKAWESLAILMSHPEVAHEVRLTLDPSLAGEALEIARRCKAAGVRSFALQEVRLQGVRDSYTDGYEASARAALSARSPASCGALGRADTGRRQAEPGTGADAAGGQARGTSSIVEPSVNLAWSDQLSALARDMRALDFDTFEFRRA